MNNPKISIVTVCYNAIDTIEGTILSVISQTYKNIEYIIVDGASTDGTLEIIQKYRNHISKIISEPDNGIYDAMNKAVTYSNGEWINFMNSGDVYTSSTVISSIFEKHIEDRITFIYSDFYYGKRKCQATYEKGVILHQSVFYRIKKHQEYGMYVVKKPYIISDYLFFLRFNPSEVLKANVVISNNSLPGVSSAINCFPQKICGDYIFGKLSFSSLIYNLCLWRIKMLFGKLLHY